MARTQLQVDVSPRFLQALKILAATDRLSLKDLVTQALVDKYPLLREVL